jgi:hypothetical protein
MMEKKGDLSCKSLKEVERIWIVFPSEERTTLHITFLPTSKKKPSIKCISSEIRTFGSVLDVLVTL